MNNTKPKSVLLPRTDFVLSIVGKNTSPTREKKVLLQKLGSHLAPSDEGAGERSETEGEKKLRFFVALHLLSLRHGKAVPPPSSEGGENC